MTDPHATPYRVRWMRWILCAFVGHQDRPVGWFYWQWGVESPWRFVSECERCGRRESVRRDA